jgi:hypothetical protein
MSATEFARFAETVKVRTEGRRVAAVTVTPKVIDCSGDLWFADVMLQESSLLSGYCLETDAMLAKTSAKHWHNAVVRSGMTLVVFGRGGTTTGPDVSICPVQAMPAGSIGIGQGADSHRATLSSAASPGDVFEIKSSTLETLRNGQPTGKRGFYPYLASGDDKHQVRLADKKSARIYLEYTETDEGSAGQ